LCNAEQVLGENKSAISFYALSMNTDFG
jgi:hypothetical protein